MQDQPRYEVYEPSRFFKDGLSSRPLVEGTVARGYLREDQQLYTGKNAPGQAGGGNSSNGGGGQQAGQNQVGQNQTGAGGANATGATGGAAGGNARDGGGAAGAATGSAAQASGAARSASGAAADTDSFPFPVTAEVLNRGQERYKIFCAMCHGALGNGDGMIVRRGFRRPPAYNEERLVTAPVGHFFDVITNGWGSMPSYNQQVPVHDRWAIIAYIRALQLSQRNQPQPGAQPGAPVSAPLQGGDNNPPAGGHQ
jgi:mono/diheme cytochrome c family protein